MTQFASSSLAPTFKQISDFYGESETQGAQFSANIQKAISDGYNPTLISQILQAGPAQESQLLQGLVNAQGTGLNNLITGAMSAMSKEGAAAVEQARLTQEAVSSKSSAMAAQLGSALAISQALTLKGAQAQVDALIASLGGGSLANVGAIAKQYGIALPTALQSQITAVEQYAAELTKPLPAALTQTVPQTTSAAGQHGAAVVTALANAHPGVTGAAGALATSIAPVLSSSAPASGAAGTAHVTAFTGAIAIGNGAASTAGKALAKSASDSAAQNDSKPAGRALVDGVIAGVGLEQDTLNAAVLKAVKSAIDYAGPLAGGQSVGEDIDNGIAAGINAGSGGINAAAIAVAKNALAAATGPQGINSGSPSRLFADEVGLPIAQGIAAGMLAGAPLVASAATVLARFALGATRAWAPLGVSVDSALGQLGTSANTIDARTSLSISVAGNADRATVALMEQTATQVLTTHVNTLTELFKARAPGR